MLSILPRWTAEASVYRSPLPYPYLPDVAGYLAPGPVARASPPCDPAGLADCLAGAEDAFVECVHDGLSNCGTKLVNAQAYCRSHFGQCGGGLACCSGQCTNLRTDPRNCGNCGTACPSGVCTNGACGCPSGLTSCNGSCKNLSTDSGNCGTCGNVCPVDYSCAGGTCVPKPCYTAQFQQCLQNAQQWYAECLAEPPTNPSICNNIELRMEQACIAQYGCDGGACCSGVCRDIRLDPANCGACGTVCQPGQNCCLGCTDLNTDNSNCGACWNVCMGGMTCQGGKCRCPTNLQLCGQQCIDTQGADRANCGGCGIVCPGNQICNSGICGCPPKEVLCGQQCTDTQSDGGNCGSCGTSCGGGQTCIQGSCQCPPNTSACNGNCCDQSQECVQGTFNSYCQDKSP